MDENLLFTAEILTLNGDLVFSRVAPGQHVIKNVACQGYLTVDDGQLRALYYFQAPKTVPAALEEMIRDRTCLSFREFYELVLKANQAGVLRNAKTKEQRTSAVRWILELPPKPVLLVSVLGLLGALGMLLWRGMDLPLRWEEPFVGWVFTCLLLSLGEVAATSVLRRAGGEVYQPRFAWRSLLPRFRADLRDAVLVGRNIQASVVFARSAFLALGSAFLLLWRPGLALVPVCILVLDMRPVSGGLVGALCTVLRRRRVLATEERCLYQANRSPARRLSQEWACLEWRITLLQLFSALCWVACLGRIGYGLAGLPLRTAFPSLHHWLTALALIAGACVASLAVALFLLFLSSLLTLVKSTRWRWQRRVSRFRFRQAEGDRMDNPSVLIRESLLLRKLDYSTQQELSQHLKPYTAKTWQTVIDYDEEPTFIGIIVSGSVTAFRRNKSGRRSKHMLLGEGDVFGAHALVDPYNPKMELRTNSPLHALVMPVEVFRTMVVTKLGRNVVYEATQKQVFLRRLPLCSGWKPHVVSRFAQIAQVVQYKPGELVIRQGGESRAFYLLFEGSARVMRGVHRVGRIQPGDFIGEIGLLQNSDCNADVEAEEESLCMVVNKVDFLRFITHNHAVALQIEEIANSRLGRSIYPLDPFSFETR
jgi:CRP-like cAMP-binding protein